MRRSTWSLSTSISRMPAMRLSRSRGEMISSRFCFSSTPTTQVRGDGIGELARIVDAHGGDHRVVVQVVRQLHVLLEQRDDAAHRAFRLAAGLARLGQHLDDDAVEPLVFLPLDGARPIDALDQHLDVAVGQLQALHDVGDAAHRVDVFRPRVVHRRVVLRGEEDALVLHQRVLERAGRRGPSDHERHHHVREHDDVPQRDDRERFVDFQGGFHISNW